jgi:hypothetical protein
VKNTVQKIGGIAAIFEASAYIIGFVVMFFLLTPANFDTLSSTEKLHFLLDHKILFQTWIITIYVIFGIALVLLTIALNERLKIYSSPILQTATVFGFIWAGMVIASGMIANIGLDSVAAIFVKDQQQATAIWLAIEAVHNGIGGGVEIVGGVWILLISWVGLKYKELPRALNYIGLIVAVAGILSVVPNFGALGAIFGIVQIIWFAWIGAFLLSKSAPLQ